MHVRNLARLTVRRMVRVSRALDDSLLGAAIGALIILGYMVAIPVLLPLIFGGGQW